MIIAPSVEITLTFHFILSSRHDCWLLAASELATLYIARHACILPPNLPTTTSPINAHYNITSNFSENKLSRSRNVCCVIVNIAYVNILYNPQLTW